MHKLITRAALALALIAGFGPVIAQQFPTVPDNSVIGRIGAGTGSGPSQAIPLANVQAALNASVNTIAQLRALPRGASNSANLLGYYAAGDGGGGLFIWNSTSTAADNNGSIIAVAGVTTGRWIRQVTPANTFAPEMFGAKADGTTNDANAIDDLMSYLTTVPSGGTLQWSCSKTYSVGVPSGTGPYGSRGNGRSVIRAFSNVAMTGCGPSSIVKMANNVNTTGTFWYWGIYNTSTLNNAVFSDFTLDMNGAQNSCSATCYLSNVALGAAAGDNITVRNITFINNPGSNDTVFGSNTLPPTVTNLTLDNLYHFNFGDRVNAASLDFSADFFIATNVTYSNIRCYNGPTSNGSCFELHGNNVVASNIVVDDVFNCGIISNEPSGTSSATNQITVSNVACVNVKYGGILIGSKSGATTTNVNISDLNVLFKTGFAGYGVDACSVVDAASAGNINLTIQGLKYYSDVVTSLGNDSAGVWACRWTSAAVTNSQFYNTQGPAIRFSTTLAAAALKASGNQIVNPGRTATTAYQAGLVVETNATLASTIDLGSNAITGTVRYAAIVAQNASAGFAIGTYAPGATVAQYNWTGTGYQASIRVGADVSGLGTGVATALGINPGTAGSVVLNGGALGSPSSAGTMPAFTLGGGIAGGANQINNIIIGASTPLAGTFTTTNATTTIQINSKLAWSATSPSIGGGFCTTPSITGANGTAAFIFTVGAAGCASSTGTISLPTATSGWSCRFSNLTNPNNNKPDQISSTTTSVGIQNYSRTTGATLNWTNGDSISAACAAY